MKRILALVLALTLVFSLAACAPKAATPAAPAGDAAATPTAAEKPLIGVTIYKYDDNFMSFVRRAVEKNAADGAEIIMNDSQNNQSTQNEQVDMMISKGVKALAINLVDPQAAATIVTKAKAANIPVVFFNKEPDASVLASYDKCWYVGTTSSESGVMQGKVIVDAWKADTKLDKNGDGKMQYVLLKGEPGHPDAEARTKFAVDTVKEAGIEVDELELQTGMWDSVKGKELMDAWIAKHGDKIEMVICNNDAMALGAIQSLKANGYFTGDKKMPVVGVDAIPDALEQIKSGLMLGTVLNDAANQGAATAQLAVNAANGKDPLDGTKWTLDDKKAVRVPYVQITMQNLNVAEEAYK
ncbi:MAG TPA: galactose/glucose ABC transporter substrate-binding protein MglB [Clostridia bacterium]|nr:galactose/glucose ABC transporter substrate-binding protein MglB [Clostridia bacterium]